MTEGILDSLDFLYLNVCVECVKGKQIKHKRLGANRSLGILELIHMDIFGSFPTASWNGQRYFISFIEDYSRYGIYISFKRNLSLWTCSKYSELKLKLNSARKLSVSDLTVDRYDSSEEQRPGPFADFLEESGIVP